MITAVDMREAGYKVAATISEDDIRRWCLITDDSYIAKVWPSFDPVDRDVKKAEMSIVFLQLVNANASATRAGGKVKLSPAQSERAYVGQQDVAAADHYLRVLQTKSGSVQGELSEIVSDVADIYYRNTFVNI